jgi:feruloyl esterase
VVEGDAPSVIDMLSVIEKWADEGKAPDSIIARRPPNQKPMKRPICPYQQIAEYKGSWSIDDAVNFE